MRKRGRGRRRGARACPRLALARPCWGSDKGAADHQGYRSPSPNSIRRVTNEYRSEMRECVKSHAHKTTETSDPKRWKGSWTRSLSKASAIPLRVLALCLVMASRLHILLFVIAVACALCAIAQEPSGPPPPSLLFPPDWYSLPSI